MMTTSKTMRVSGSLSGARSRRKNSQGSGRKELRAPRRPSSPPSLKRVTVCALLPLKTSKRRWQAMRWQTKTLKPCSARSKESLETSTPSSKERKSNRISFSETLLSEDEGDVLASKRKRSTLQKRREPKKRDPGANSGPSKSRSKSSCSALMLRSHRNVVKRSARSTRELKQRRRRS